MRSAGHDAAIQQGCTASTWQPKFLTTIAFCKAADVAWLLVRLYNRLQSSQGFSYGLAVITQIIPFLFLCTGNEQLQAPSHIGHLCLTTSEEPAGCVWRAYAVAQQCFSVSCTHSRQLVQVSLDLWTLNAITCSFNPGSFAGAQHLAARSSTYAAAVGALQLGAASSERINHADLVRQYDHCVLPIRTTSALLGQLVLLNHISPD